MNENDRVRFRHMLDTALESLEFAKGITRETLNHDKILVKALTMNIAIIGEAASRITKETQSQYSQISWAGMIGMRNVLIHDYYEVDLDQLWSTLQDNLPSLITQLKSILSSEDNPDDHSS